MLNEMKIELAFKDLTFPSEGGVITGHTTDNKAVEGMIKSNRKLDFTLKNDNHCTLYFKG